MAVHCRLFSECVEVISGLLAIVDLLTDAWILVLDAMLLLLTGCAQPQGIAAGVVDVQSLAAQLRCWIAYLSSTSDIQSP